MECEAVAVALLNGLSRCFFRSKDYVLVHRSKEAEFIERMVKLAKDKLHQIILIIIIVIIIILIIIVISIILITMKIIL